MAMGRALVNKSYNSGPTETDFGPTSAARVMGPRPPDAGPAGGNPQLDFATSTITNGSVFKQFDVAGGDVLLGMNDIESATCWDDPNGILIGTEMIVAANPAASNYEVIRSSSLYYINVYQNQDEADLGVDPHFAIAFGHKDGSGSAESINTGYTGTNPSYTPSRAVYSQYRNLLLQPGDQMFTFDGTGSKSIFVINFNRSKYKEKLDPGNWELTLGTAYVGNNDPTDLNRTLIDDSLAGFNPEINAAGRVFKIKKGTIALGTSSADSRVYGLAYPDVGILVLHPEALIQGSLLPGVTMADINGAPQLNLAWASSNIEGFYTNMVTGNNFQARTEERVTSTYYFVRVRNNEFNYSNNPTFVTGSSNLIRYGMFQNDPRVYITGVGLYDDNNQLLAVAKLSRPLLKSFTREALIRVKLTY